MIIPIVCLATGIVGFVTGRMSITKGLESRGPLVYVAATLFCLPLPVTLICMKVTGALASQGKSLDRTEIIVFMLSAYLPVVLGLLIGFAAAKRKIPAGTDGPRGFEAKV